MLLRILLLVLCFFSLNILAQKADSKKTSNNPSASNPQTSDELFKHLKAAETFQLAGDLANAAVENQALLGIALQRFGNIAIEEGKYTDAVKYLSESLKFADTSSVRTTLAIAYLRQNLFDKALAEAKTAVSIDSDHVGSRYILSNAYYAKEDYESALPELEWVFAKAPDFEIGRALGLTYLNLRQPEKARKHFETLQALVGEEKAGLHILFAKFYERTNYPAEAERELKRALELEPLRPKVNLYLGYLLMQHGGSGRLTEAGAAFEKELKITPDDFYALFFLGVVNASLDKNQEAIAFLKKAIEVNPESGEAYLFLAQAQIGIEDLVNAEKNLRRAIEFEAKGGGKNTQARRTHYMLGRLLLKTGRKEEAQKELAIAAELQQKSLDSSRSEVDRILNQVVENKDFQSVEDEKADADVRIELKPERIAQLEKIKSFLTEIIAQSYNNLGVIATQNNQSSEAIKNFSAAYEWKPDFPNLSRNIGILSFQANEFKKAIAPLKKHLTANPKDVLIRKMLGSGYYFIKDFKNSVETLKPLEADLAKDAELAYFYGFSLIQLERNQEAATIFKRLAETSQNTPQSLFYAAQGFMMLGDYLRAVKEFERVIALVPNTTKVNYFTGQSFIRLNRLADAEKAFARELEINPGDPLSKYHLALTLIERKIESEKAVQMLREAIDLRADYADAYYQLGKIYLEKGETQKAIEQLEKAVSLDTEKDYMHYQLSIAYRKADRKADADRELQIYQKLKKDKRKTEELQPMGGKENITPEIN